MSHGSEGLLRALRLGEDQLVIKPGTSWGNAWKLAAAVAVLGFLGVLSGAVLDPDRFAFSYLFAFIFTLSLAIGGLFFVMIQHLTASGWSVSVRRSAEFVLGGMPVVPLLFLPLLLLVPRLYEWQHAGAGHAASEQYAGGVHHGAADSGTYMSPIGPNKEAHGQSAPQPHGGEAHASTSHSGPEADLHHRLLEHKAPYLNLPFFIARALLYLAVWVVLAALYRRWSFAQDKSKDMQLTRRMAKWSPLGLALMGLTLTFAAFDWLMSLEPTWYSTIFGVYVFAGAVVAIFALVIVLTMALRASGYLGDAVNEEHYHDLGKLMFGFNCFWAYIAVSQMLLIWYAGIPEEATYYHRRWNDSGYRGLSLLLVVGHFVLPFLFLISRVVKRRLTWLRFGALWMLFMHCADVYWFVMPYADGGVFHLHWLDAACLFFAVGMFATLVLRRMVGAPLLPMGDPRLERSLTFQNA